MKISCLILFILFNINALGQSSKPAPIFPFTNANIEKFEEGPKNANAIPLLNYEGENRLYPITYTQAALAYYANYLQTNNQAIKDKFLNIANFIKNDAKQIRDFVVLHANFKVENYEFETPAASSMAQGFAIGIMIQAYSLTKDESYLEMAEKFIKSFNVSIKEGGVRSSWGGYPFYEEYADPNSHVLNGYIFSLSGLYYAYKTLGNKDAKKYYDEGIETLKVKIPKYDAEFTSYYNKLVNKDGVYIFASAINEDPDHYHELEIYQLLTLFEWSKEPIFKEYAHKFLQQDTGFVNDFYDFPKFKNISASATIDPKEHGVNHLDDELWSWGNYWSTNQFPTDLIIDFGEEKDDISAVTFYSISENTLPKNFSIWIMENGKWIKSYDAYQLRRRNRNYYKTSNFETFIETYYLPRPKKSDKIKISFVDSRADNIITLREINVHYNREKEVNHILDKISKKVPLKGIE